MSDDERLVWLLGDLMDAVENYFGAENPKRLGHINSSAIRIIDEIITPLRAEIERLRAALRRTKGVLRDKAVLDRIPLALKFIDIAFSGKGES